jgi:hypothetical protein
MQQGCYALSGSQSMLACLSVCACVRLGLQEFNTLNTLTLKVGGKELFSQPLKNKMVAAVNT